MRYLRLAGAAAVAVTVLAACGGDPGTGATPPSPAEAVAPVEATGAPEPPIDAPQVDAPEIDACALVSKAEAEKLAGTPLEDAVSVRETCTYTGPVSGPLAQVEVFVGDGAQKILDIDRELGHEFETLSGIGDEAHLQDGSVFVHASGVWVAIRLVRLDDMATYDKRLTELARTVAGRL
ncbi:hypothetical protein [Micromonospora sp. WMMD1082]|uniref:hypothetical protein n=1 Tax=Micromonospora sp. WMMD1082 TaxID=3016104 RepID=UPI002417DCF7|nr:hypothetical protein [Micromonospora sp. WMMD1082]MDG4798797.1 hypothetical protein [Micromonospora sp. WMMD1082]